MSSSRKSTGIAEHSTKHITVMGADGEIGFEGTDAPAKVVIYALGIVGVLAAFAFALMFGYDKFLEFQHPPGNLPSPLAPARILAPAPQIERLPWLDLPELRAHEEQVLKSSGRDEQGHMHVPMEKAMDAVLSKINTKADGPTGITVPGGQDRVFSHGLADMPRAYQRLSQTLIQGEIHKNAQ